MNRVSFTIPGRLRGKGRPRAKLRGKFVMMHSDAATVNAEAMVRDFAAKAMAGRPLLTNAVNLTIVLYLQKPASWSRKKRLENPIPTGKPDLDNIAKLVSDAINGIVWLDDSQVATLTVSRVFGSDGEPERADVTASEFPQIVAVAA